MKKKFITLFIIAGMISTACACGAAPGDDNAPADSVTATEMVASDVAADESFYTAPAGESVYSLTKTDDTNAVLVEHINYSDTYYCEYTYIGTYEEKDDKILFTYIMEDYATTMELTMAGDKVVAVGYIDGDVSEFAGTYTCEDIEYGHITLTIAESGDATVVIGDTTLNGSAFINSQTDLLEVAAYNEAYGTIERNPYDMEESAPVEDLASTEIENVDWYVTLDGDTFTYETYYSTEYADQAGAYTCFGDLGELEIVVSESGIATTTATVDGKAMEFSGYCNIDMDTQELNGFYLYTDDNNYTLDLHLETMTDGTLNYSGSITTPLSAG